MEFSISAILVSTNSFCCFRIGLVYSPLQMKFSGLGRVGYIRLGGDGCNFVVFGSGYYLMEFSGSTFVIRQRKLLCRLLIGLQFKGIFKFVLGCMSTEIILLYLIQVEGWLQMKLLGLSPVISAEIILLC